MIFIKDKYIMAFIKDIKLDNAFILNSFYRQKRKIINKLFSLIQ
jgi:hypothetical protein